MLLGSVLGVSSANGFIIFLRGGSMSINYTCDRCQKTFGGKPYDTIKSKDENVCLDLCLECRQALDEWINLGLK